MRTVDNGFVASGARGVTSQGWDDGGTCPACLAWIKEKSKR